MRSNIVRALIVPFVIITLLTIHASAVPPLPAEFYGSISVDGKPAPVGTAISAQINGVVKGSFITISEGFYGGPGLFDARLKVNVTEEEYRPGEMMIAFIINGGQANQTADFEPGNSKQLDLTIGAGGISLQPTGIITPSGTVSVQQGLTPAPSGQTPTPLPGTSTITYGLDQARTFTAEDGLAEISFTKDTMLFSPDGQFLNAVGLRPRSITDLPPLPANQSLRFTGYAYEIIPEGTYFNPKGTLTLKLPPDRAFDIVNAGPVIYEYLPQTASWEPVNTGSNVFTSLITADIFEAAIYGLYIPANIAGGMNNSSLVIPVTSGTPPAVSLYPDNTTNQTIIAPIITPQSIITPQEVITPLPSQEVTLLPDTPRFIPEPSGTQGGQDPAVQPGQIPLRIPGLGLVSAIVSAIKSKLSGPVLAALGVFSIIILINVIVYAVYKYWWQQRAKNG